MLVKDKIIHCLSLFASSATLLCCAIPALLIILGFGATVASIVSLAPQLIWLSERKIYVFGVALILLVISNWVSGSNREKACEGSEGQIQVCQMTKQVSKTLLFTSGMLFLMGAVFTFILPKMLL